MATGGPGSPMQYVGAGAEIVAPILLFGFGGYHLDAWWGTKPLMLMIGSLLGVGGFVIALVMESATPWKQGKRVIVANRRGRAVLLLRPSTARIAAWMRRLPRAGSARSRSR